MPALEDHRKNYKSDKLLTIEAANLLSISKTTLLKYEKEGLISAFRDANGYRFFDITEVLRLRDYIKKQRIRTGKETKNLLSSTESAGLLGVSITTLFNYEKLGRITSTRSDKGFRFFDQKALLDLKKQLAKEAEKKQNTSVKNAVQKTLHEKKQTANDTKKLKKFKALAVTTSGLALAMLILLAIYVVTPAANYRNAGILSLITSSREAEKVRQKTLEMRGAVLGQINKNREYALNIQVPSQFLQDANFVTNATVGGILTTPTLTFSGTGTINELDAVDTVTELTLENTLEIAGEVVSSDETGLTNVVIAEGVIDGTNLADVVEYDGDFVLGGTLEINNTWYIGGTEVTATGDEINILSGLGVTAEELNLLSGSTAESGGVVFGDGSAFTQDAVNFYWDDATDRLGIGTDAPTTTLQVIGGISTTTFTMTNGAVNNYVMTSDAVGNATWSDIAATGGPWTLSGSNLYPDLISYNVAIGATDAGSADLYVAGTVGISTTTPDDELDVAGEIDTSTYYKLDNLKVLDVLNTNSLLVGHGAGSSLTVGQNNTVVGNNAGYALTTQSFNTLFGYNAGYALTASSNTAIGAYALDSETTGVQNVAIGNYALYESTGVSFNTALGAAMKNSTNSNYNVALGSEALDDTTDAYDNVGVGISALRNITGVGNVAVGNYAMWPSSSFGVDASENTAIGYFALLSIETGTGNLAAGANSLDDVESGDYNVGLGYNAGSSLVTGSRNVLVGKDAGDSLTDGTANVFIGVDAGQAASTGSDNNVVIGYQSGNSLTTSDDGNVFLGYQSGFSETGSNKLYIENSSSSTPLIYGDFSTDDLIFYGTGEFDTGTADGVALTIDQDDVDQIALDFDINNTAGNIINMDWGGATVQSAALSGITLDFSNLTSVAGSTTYGLLIDDLDGQTTSTEHAIYQRGTNWDYGAFIDDLVYFGSNVGIGDVSPDSTLEILSTAATQFRISYADGSADTSFAVDINGNLTINTSGGEITIPSSDNLNLTAAINLIFGGTTSLGETTAANDSGAYLVGAFDEFANSNSANVQDVLDDLDATITSGGAGSMWTLASDVIYPTDATDDFAVGGTTIAASMFGIDESTGNFYFGYDNSANPTLLFEATDADAGTFGFNTNDTFYFSGASVGIGTINALSNLHIESADPSFRLHNTNGGGTYWQLGNIGATDSSLILQPGGEYTFAIRDNLGTNLFYVTTPVASNNTIILTDRVGIGDTTPDSVLEISLDGLSTDAFMISSDDALDGDLVHVNSDGQMLVEDKVSVGSGAHWIPALLVEDTITGTTATEGFVQYVNAIYDIADSGLKQALRTRARTDITSGTIDDLISVLADVTLLGNGGTVSQAYSFYGNLFADTGATITEGYNFYADEFVGSGTIGTQYGLYIEDLDAGATANYGVYIAGANTYALYAAADDVAILDDLFVGSASEAVTNAGFTLDNDDAYIHDLLGVGDSIYVENSVILGSTLTLSDSGIMDSSNINLQADSDTTNFIYLSNGTEVGTEDVSALYWDSILAYTNDPGFSVNDSGQVVYRDEDSSSWVTLDSLINEGVWDITSNVIHPVDTADDLALGSNAQATSVFFVDVSEAATYFYNTTSEPTLNFKASNDDEGILGFNDNDSFYISDAKLGIGDTTPDATFDVDGSVNIDLADSAQFFIDAQTAVKTVDAFVIDAQTLTNGVDAAYIDLLVSGDTGNSTDTFSALNIQVTQSAIDQALDDSIYGIWVQDLGGTPLASGGEIAILQEGSSWDWGLYMEDDAYIAGGSAGLYVGSTAENITNAGFVLSGDDAYVHDLLGVADDIYVEDSVIIGSTLTLSDSSIMDSANLNLSSDGDSTNFLYLSNGTEVGSEDVSALYWDSILAYTNDPGFSVNDSGQVVYRDENSTSWITLDSLSGSGGLWEDGTNGVYENDEAVVVGADAAFTYVSGSGIGDLRVADDFETIDDGFIGGDLVIGASTSSTETLSDAGFSLGGNDLFVAGSLGVESGIFVDGDISLGTGAARTISLPTATGTTYALTIKGQNNSTNGGDLYLLGGDGSGQNNSAGDIFIGSMLVDYPATVYIGYNGSARSNVSIEGYHGTENGDTVTAFNSYQQSNYGSFSSQYEITRFNSYNYSGAGSNGLYGNLVFNLEDTSSNLEQAARISYGWIDATNNTEDAALKFSVAQNSVLVDVMYLDETGSVGIGNTDPDFTLEVTGTIAASSLPAGSGQDVDWNSGTGQFLDATASSKLYKDNIENISFEIDDIMNLQPVSFTWNEHSATTGVWDFGLVAEEVASVMPELTVFDTDGITPIGVRYNKLNILLLSAFQQQQVQIRDLAAYIESSGESKPDPDSSEDQLSNLQSGLVTLETEVLGLRTDIENLQTQIQTLQDLEITTPQSTQTTSPPEYELFESPENVLAQIQDLFTQIKDFVATLGMTTATDENGNSILAVSSDLTIMGDTTVTDLFVTGDLQAGLLKVDSLENALNILGPSCINNEELCHNQTLYLQKNLAGNVDFFAGKMVFEPNGDLLIAGTLTANEVKAEKIAVTEIQIKTDGETAQDSQTIGTAVIPAGETEITLTTDSIETQSKIFATPEQPVTVAAKVQNDNAFTLTIASPLAHDLNVNWWVIN